MNWKSLFALISRKSEVISTTSFSWTTIAYRPDVVEAQATLLRLLGKEAFMGFGSQDGRLLIFEARDRAAKLADTIDRMEATKAVRVIDRAVTSTQRSARYEKGG